MLLLDAAEQLMREDGYAAVTSRRVGDKAGLAPQLVHYYFRTMDDLFLALWRRYADKNLVRQAKAFASGQPLTKIWEYSTDAMDTSLGVEFMALARHRKAIRAELCLTGERYRNMQVAAFSEIMEQYGLGRLFESPEVLCLVISAVSRGVVMEDELGISTGHAKLLALVERWLKQLEGSGTRTGRAPRKGR